MIIFKRLNIWTQCCKYFDILHHNHNILCCFLEVSDTDIFFLRNLCLICIFSKALVVTGGVICPGGGSHFSPTKNNYGGPSRQNVYPIMMISNVSNRTGAYMSNSNTVWRWNQWLNWCVARNILMKWVVIERFKGYFFSFEYGHEIFFSSISQVIINHIALSKTVS